MVCLYLVFVLAVCFFFKQKTAYEMRISDWSSDVCSSDLDRRSSWAGWRHPTLRSQRPSRVPGKEGGTIRRDAGMSNTPSSPREIGRVSCRASVCQYV